MVVVGVVVVVAVVIVFTMVVSSDIVVVPATEVFVKSKMNQLAVLSLFQLEKNQF